MLKLYDPKVVGLSRILLAIRYEPKCYTQLVGTMPNKPSLNRYLKYLMKRGFVEKIKFKKEDIKGKMNRRTNYVITHKGRVLSDLIE